MLPEPHRRYLSYLANHREHVLRAATDLGISGRGIRHDLSKYEADEFEPYAEYFYGLWRQNGQTDHLPVPEDVQLAFDQAWLLHQKRNSHHWQYHVLREDSGVVKVLRMPELDAREMLADWRGAGLAITGSDNTAQWYLKNRTNMLLHPDTQAFIENRLHIPTQTNEAPK